MFGFSFERTRGDYLSTFFKNSGVVTYFKFFQRGSRVLGIGH